MRWPVALALALTAFFMAANPVRGQPLCGSRDGLVEELKNGWDEILVAQGLANANNRLIELFISKDGKTWTLIITYPKGESCVITSGHDWSAASPKLLKPMGLPV